MSDITKCKGNNCPMKDNCYRYTSKADDYQSWFTESPIVDGKCDVYWGIQSQSIYEQLKNITDGKGND